MNLNQKLDEVVTYLQENVPPEALTTITQATADLKASGIAARSLQVGDRVADFTLPNASGEPVQLKALLDKGPVVISFYRGSWCPFCSLELRSLQAALPGITAAGGTLVAISPQTPDQSLSTAEKEALTFEVLSDVGNRVARQFGIVYQLSESMRSIQKGFGVDLSSYNGDETYELPISATYVIANDSTIIYSFLDPDFTRRAEPSEVIAALNH